MAIIASKEMVCIKFGIARKIADFIFNRHFNILSIKASHDKRNELFEKLVNAPMHKKSKIDDSIIFPKTLRLSGCS